MFRHLVNLLFSILPPSRLFKLRRFLLLQSKIFVSANSRVCGRGWFYGRGDVFIGESSWLSPGVIFYTHNEAYIKIGKNCDIGPGVKFIIGSHKIGTSKRRAGQGTANSIIIGDGCWIGAGAIILDGIKIEDGCIIAAGAVVTKDVGINKLVAGVPAVLKEIYCQLNRILFICNAFEDITRTERKITTDSPACSNKIFSTCKSFNTSNTRVTVLSLGRGRVDKSEKYFFCKSKVVRYNGIPVIYAPFTNFPILSQLFSIVWPSFILIRFKLSKYKYNYASIFWNRTLTNLFTLLVSKSVGMKNILDLEDGETFAENSLINHFIVKFNIFIYKTICTKYILSNKYLSLNISDKKFVCYYGAIEKNNHFVDFSSNELNFIYSGTITKDTGSKLFLETIKKMKESNTLNKKITIHITGKGDGVSELIELSKDQYNPKVEIHGRLTDIDYKQLLKKSHVGLSLKINNGKYANTTFPSKVIEITSQGLLLLTTDISDVYELFKETVIYTQSNSEDLINKITLIVNNPDLANMKSTFGKERVLEFCSFQSVSMKLNEFIFDN